MNDARYTFKDSAYNGEQAIIYRKKYLPKFRISKELRSAVYENMPADLSCEEKAIYIYYRLCYLLDYDENFFYQKKLGKEYNQEFKKDTVAEVKPGSKIICGDFSIIYYQFLSEIDGVEPVIIEKNNYKEASHFLNGFYTDRISLTCEAINVTRSETIGYSGTSYSIGANDLSRVKTGIFPNGISGFDLQGILPQIMSDMYVKATGNTAKDNYEDMFYEAQEQYYDDLDWEEMMGLNRLLNGFHDAPKTEINKSVVYFEKRFKAFLKVLQENNLKGNTAYITFYNLDEIGFFGGKTTDTKVGEKVKENGKEFYRRLVILQRDDTSNLYCFDPNELSIQTIEREQVERKIASGDWMYEKEEERLLD